MALPFPNVPNLAGVPGIPRLPGGVVSVGLTIASGAISALLGQSAQKQSLWGVFDTNNKPVLSPDSILGFSYRKRMPVADFPVVDGGFADYNKVNTPFEIQVRLSKGSRSIDRANLLKQIKALLASVQLYKIVTPEQTFTNCNLEDFDMNRNGGEDAYFLKDTTLTFVEILQATAQYTNTAVNTSNAQSSAALPASNVGTVQPQVPSGVLLSSGQSAQQSAGAFPSLF